MQDTSTGLMHQIPKGTFESEDKFVRESAQFRSAMDPIIRPEYQGAIFREGETVQVNGARFIVRKIIKKGLVLHGVPSK